MSGIDVNIGANTTGLENGVKRASDQLNKLSRVSNQSQQALTNLSRVAQDAPYGFIGIANNINPLLESFQRLQAETGSTKNALKALGSSMLSGGGLGLAVGIASSLLVTFGDRLFGASRAAKEAKSSADKLKEAIQGIFNDSGKEAAEVQSLITVLKAETETRDRKLAAIKELQKIQPEVFSGLKLEGNAVIGLDDAYKNYLTNLRSVIAAKILQAKLEQLITKQLESQGATATGRNKELLDANKKLVESAKSGQLGNNALTESLKISSDKKDKAAQQLEADIADIIKQLGEISNSIKIPELKIKPDKVKIEIPKARDVPELVLPSLKIKPLKLGDFLDDKAPKIKFHLPQEAQAALDALQARLQSIRDTAQFVASSISDAFGQAFDSIASGKNVFESIGQALKSMVLNMIKAIIQALILKSILRFLDPTGAIGNAVGGLFSHRAAGGPVSSGNPYMVGERGPELFMPSTSGRIVPTNQLSGLQGSAMQLVSVRVEGVIDGRTIRLVQTQQERYERRNG